MYIIGKFPDHPVERQILLEKSREVPRFGSGTKFIELHPQTLRGFGGDACRGPLHYFGSSSTVGGVSWPQPVDSTQGDAFQREILVSRNIGKNLPYSL